MTGHLANNILATRWPLEHPFGIECKDLKIVVVWPAAGDWGRSQICGSSKGVLAQTKRGIEAPLPNVCGVRNCAFRDLGHRGKQVEDDGMDERVWQWSVRILNDHDDRPGPGRETIPLEIRRKIVSGLGETIGDPILVRKIFARDQNRFRNVRKLVSTHRKLSVARPQDPQQFSKHLSSRRQTEWNPGLDLDMVDPFCALNMETRQEGRVRRSGRFPKWAEPVTGSSETPTFGAK